MNIHFATNDRAMALRFIRAALPDRQVEDSPSSAGPLLDLVERDIVRVQDPMMHGQTIAIIASDGWTEQHREAVVAACRLLHEAKP